MAFHLGTGSWADPAYRSLLTAPAGVPASERLRAYAAWFDHVEVNSSYYATPSPATVAQWLEQTPEGFTFTLKLHRAFSQNPQKAATSGDLTQRMLAAAAPLVKAKRFGCFLLVLGPSFRPDKHALNELDELVAQLAAHALAVELRDRAWVTGKQREATLAYFRERRLAWVAVDMPRIAGSALMPPVDEVTRPDLAYLRLHGRNPHYDDAKSAAERHTYAYDAAELRELAKRARHLAEKAEHVHVIANNHAEDFAPKTALALRELLRD